MKYYLIAGEASGDLHGSNLMKGLKAEDPEAEFRFWGGGLMEAVGGTKVRDYKDTAIMGVAEILGSLRKISANLKACKADILDWKPDVVILIDYPGFNMKIAKFCHEHGVRVFYYIAPKTWASREGRNRKLKAWVDRLFIVFPFEIPYFESRGIPFIYKGNPLVDAIDGFAYSPEGIVNSAAEPAPAERLAPLDPTASRSPLSACRGWQRSAEAGSAAGYVAILPGSRKGEIARTLPGAMAMADALHALPEYAGWQFVVAGAPARSEEDYLPLIAGRPYVKLVFGRTYDVLKFASAAMVNSGTASLEAALIGTPQVVCWSTSNFNAFIGQHILHVLDHIKYISLGNLILDKLAFRELIQYDFTPEAVTAEIRRLVEDEAYRAEMLADYAEIRSRLGGSGASRAVAAAMIAEIRA